MVKTCDAQCCKLHDPSDFSLKVGTVVRDNLLQYSKPTNDVVFYELGHMFGLLYGIGSCLYPLGEVVIATKTYSCPFKPLRAIFPITSMPHTEKGHEASCCIAY